MNVVLKKHWVKYWNRPGTLQHAQHYSWACEKSLRRILGLGISNMLFVIKENYLDWYLIREEFNGFIKRMKKNKFHDLNFLKNNNRLVLNQLRRVELFFTKFGQVDFASLSNLELTKKHQQYLRQIDQGIAAFSVAPLAEPAVDQQLREVLLNYDADIEKKAEAVLSLTKPTHVIQEEMDLLKIASTKNPSKSRIKKHWEKYSYQPCYDINVKPFPLTYFVRRIKEFRKKSPQLQLKKIKNNLRNNQRLFNLLLGDSKISKLDQAFLKYAHQFAFLKDFRSHFRSYFIFQSQKLFREISSRTNVSINNLLRMTDQEIKSLMQSAKKIDFNSREKCVYAKAKLQEFIITGKDQQLLVKKLNLNEEKNKITGIVACPGSAQGRVKIILNPNQQSKFKKNDILVSSMTRPDYLAIMKRAAAIVTDEGGITCHAAIVSRELGIPCVIGTKIATRVLKDGDVVEVDANKGIVKKL